MSFLPVSLCCELCFHLLLEFLTQPRRVGLIVTVFSHFQMKRIEAQKEMTCQGQQLPAVELIFESRSGVSEVQILERKSFQWPKESQHWMSQGEVREVDDSSQY